MDTLFGVYGYERDQRIWNAWAVLNLHKSEKTGEFEPVRCFYPLINRVPVISEATRDDPTADDFRDSLFFLNRDRFADQVLSLYRDKARFRSESERHFENFSRKSALEHITRAIDRFLASLDRRRDEV